MRSLLRWTLSSFWAMDSSLGTQRVDIWFDVFSGLPGPPDRSDEIIALTGGVSGDCCGWWRLPAKQLIGPTSCQSRTVGEKPTS
jgi:hypothetical protein